MASNAPRNPRLAVSLAAAAMLAAAACGLLGRRVDASVLRVGISHPATHSFTTALNEFAAEVTERTDGAVTVRVFPAGQLGSEREMQEMLALGSLDMTVTGVLNLYNPLFAVFELPYLFTGRDHALTVLDELPESDLAASLPAQGVRLVGYLENGFRHITTSNRQVESPADLEGLKMRTPENPAQIETFRALGADPTPMGSSELYMALAQGVVDGQENPLQNINSSRYYEVQKHLTLSAHIYNVAYVVASERSWAKSPTETRDLVLRALRDVSRRQIAGIAELDGRLEGELAEKGMEVVTPDREAFAAAARPAYEAIFARLGDRAREIVERVKETTPVTAPRRPRVFYVNSYHDGYAPSDKVRSALAETLGEAVELRIAYLDSKRRPGEPVAGAVTSTLEQIADFAPDVLIVSDDVAAGELAAKHFAEGPTPVVFCGVNWTCDQYGLPTENITGMLEVVPVEQTLATLRAIDPTIRKLAVVSEDTPSEQTNQRFLTPVLEAMGIEVSFLLASDFAAWKERFAEAAGDADAIYLPTNGAIANWDDRQALEWIAAHEGPPVFTCDAFMMPFCLYGETKVAAEQGVWAAETAKAILDGAAPSSIAVTKNSQTRRFYNPAMQGRSTLAIPDAVREQATVIEDAP